MHCKIEKQIDSMQQKQSEKFTEMEGYFLKVQFPTQCMYASDFISPLPPVQL